MEPKPSHLSLKHAEQFKDASMVDAYQYRPPYPDETFSRLSALMIEEPPTVLDVGCGTGDLCRRLVNVAERVDAVDFSEAMIEKGKALPGGDHPLLNWIYGRVEEVELRPPYALITAGESLHWMEWEVVMPIFHRSLSPRGYLAMVGRGTEPSPWDSALQILIGQYSTNRDYRPYDLVDELERRHLFHRQGTILTQPVPFVQSGEDYICSIHSRNGFSRQRMGKEAAQTFDAEVRKLLAPFLREGQLALSVFSRIVWGYE
ncbi:MAG: class I SAM-dependent methyltransferase [Ktedonobacterales bacterium]